ncbi:MAG TPA: PaaI family thioesterase [Sulfurimonas sp.]|nr:PaaI family thioesterase [Sulfurimonas sp.]
MAKVSQDDNIEEDDSFELWTDVTLDTHDMINNRYSGVLEELKEGYARVCLLTNDEMAVDSYGLVHGGFIFCAGDFAAMAAINDPNVVLASSNSDFLSPVRVGDEVVFVAHARHKDGRKREVKVIGSVLEIKVFEGTFKTVVLDKHILKLDLMHASKND